MHKPNDLFLLAQKHKGLLDGIKQDIVRIRQELDAKEASLKVMREHRADMEWAYNYLDALVKNESNRFIKELEELLNSSVQTIFAERDYSVEIVVEDNKRASIHLKYVDEDGNEISPDVKDCGGGIRTVIGIILQVYFIFYSDVERVIFVDEGFSHVASDFLPQLFGLLDELCKNNGLKLCLVTHDSRIMEYADKNYVVENNRVKLVK